MFPGQSSCEDRSIAKRSLTVLGVMLTAVVLTVGGVHVFTTLERNRNAIVELEYELEKWHVIATLQRDEIQAIRKKVRYLNDNLGVNVHLIENLMKQAKQLRRDVTNLGKNLDTDAKLLFEKLKKLRADVMTVNRSTHNLAAWLSRVDTDLDPGYLAMLETQIITLERKVR